MRKLFVAGLLSAMLSVVPAMAQDYTMRVANVINEDTAGGTVLVRVAERLNARNIGLKVEVFNGGVLGSEVETLDQISRGALEAMLSQGIVLLSQYDDRFAVEELPFLFPSSEAAQAAFDGEFGAALQAAAHERDFVILGFWENGVRHFTNSKRPIINPEDMAGLRFRSGQSPIRLDMFAALGTAALPMAFTELYSALQQGIVDGQENPLSLIRSSGFASVQKHLALSAHLYTSAPVIVSRTWFESLPEEVRNAVQEEFYNARVEQRQMLAEQSAEHLDYLKQQGMEVSEIDRASFVAATDKVWKQWEDRIGPELMAVARKIRDGGSQ